VKAVRLLVWAAGGALCAGMSLALFHSDHSETIQRRGAIGFTLYFVAITIGVLVWQLRPGNRTGILLTAIPFASVLPEARWIFWNHALAVTVGLAATQLAAPLVGHLILAYPTGRLTSRVDRAFVAFAYGWSLLYALPLLLFFDPQYPHGRYWLECWDCAVPVTHVTWHNVSGITNAFDWTFPPLVVIFLGLLVRKLWRASPGARRIVLPLWIAVFFLGVQFLVQFALYGSPVNSWTSSRWFWIVNLASLAVPVSLGIGLLWGRGARSAVADLVVELERTPPGRVRDALARTLGDPSLQLALWSRERGCYVDSHGRPLELPSSASDRAVTVLGPAHAPVAALMHDPVLLERRGLVEAAGAAARLALENERLQAELRAQLAELRASRARIVQAGDDERRRLERNLHDGAQQRLLGLGLALQLARSTLGPEANGAAELLGEAEHELRRALDELRELARGIHPAILTDQGLGPALRSLAERSAIPVTIAVPDERLEERIEAAAYFLVSESLANVARYARASAVHVSVSRRNGATVVDVDDDGVGGADPVFGSGLRGLSDRVQALDGTFQIESPPGGGTHLHAVIPCES
jgi:signal transduction histidine kinase